MDYDAEAMSRLNCVIRHPEAMAADNVMAYDNAVSALGKICQFHRNAIDAPQVWNLLKSHVHFCSDDV
jgi:importin-5